MPRVKRKTKDEDLARVRRNQRKCRERKRNYVAELESRIASCQATSDREILRLRAREEELCRENQMLKALLDSIGANQSFREQNTAEEASQEISNNMQSTLDLVAGTELPTVESYAELGSLQSFEIMSDFVRYPTDELESAEWEPFPLWDLGFPSSPSGAVGFSLDLAMSNHHVPNLLDTYTGPGLFEFMSLAGHNTTGNTITRPADAVLQDTTLCVVALELVMRCNKKNVGLLELDMKLRCGYKCARSQHEGCRIDNQVLLAVLAEILQ